MVNKDNRPKDNRVIFKSYNSFPKAIDTIFCSCTRFILASFKYIQNFPPLTNRDATSLKKKMVKGKSREI